MSTSTIYIDDFCYNYEFYEHSPHSPYGIFLMGTLQSIDSVSFFTKRFSKYLNLFIVELPGMGTTDPLPSTYSIQNQAAMLLRFVDVLRIPTAHLLSISYSTPIAAEFCALWPGAQSLSMCGGTAGVDPALRLNSMAVLKDALEDRKVFAKIFVESMMAKNPLIPNSKIIARASRQHILKHTEKQILCFCENTLRLLSYTPSPTLTRFNNPGLLFIGDSDPYVTRSMAKKLASSLGSCEFKIVPNADHLVHIEHPELTADLMLRLVKEDIDAKMMNLATVSAG